MMNRVILLFVAIATQVAASEFTASLAEKVRICDLVAVIEITQVERGHFQAPNSTQPENTYCNVKLTASVSKRIKGFSTNKIEIFACSIQATAGFWEYGIEPGKSYIAYLKLIDDGRYRLGRSSNQFLEEISGDSKLVSDIGQTTDQVRLNPKLWKLRALAAGGRPLALIGDPITLGIVFLLIVFMSVHVIRKKRANHRTQY
jgi:hypothetical protein